jgi:hypothetical protein
MIMILGIFGKHLPSENAHSSVEGKKPFSSNAMPSEIFGPLRGSAALPKRSRAGAIGRDEHNRPLWQPIAQGDLRE